MSKSFPFVSIIVPVRNEKSFIEQCLGAILAQDYPADSLEVILVDGMSDDGTRTIVQEFSNNDQRVVMIDNPKRITPCAMNLGIKKARGEVIVRVDGHAVIPPDYLSECLQWLLKEEVDGVGGAIDSESTSYVGAAIAAAMSSPFGIGNSRFRTLSHNCAPIEVDHLPFWVCRRTVFVRIGLFNEQMIRHQDYELNYRLRSSGGRLLLLPWLRVKYYVRSTLCKFWRQYWQYGLWKGRFIRTHPASARTRHFVPPLFVLAIITAMCLALAVLNLGLLCLALLAGVYGSFLVVATVMLAAKGHFKQAPLIPLVLLSLHLVWGTGVWAGLMAGKLSTVPGHLQEPTKPDSAPTVEKARANNQLR